MDSLTPATTPDATGVLRHVGSLVAPWRWPIVIACLLTAGLTLALLRSRPAVPVWSGTTIIKIGLAPGFDYLLERDGGPALRPIELKRDLAARISNPGFLTRVIAGTKFEPATAAFSRELAASTLRPVALDGDRHVSVEVSAGSSADVGAVFRSLASEISSVHDALSQARTDALRADIAELQQRADFLEKAIIAPPKPTSGQPGEGRDQLTNPASPRNMIAGIKVWNTLQDLIQRDMNLIKFTEKTVTNTEPGTFLQTERSIGPVKSAILAGLVMLGAMIVLLIAIGRARLPSI